MKTAAVLVCLALLLAIAYSAPVDTAREKALHELESLEKRVKANHQLVNDPGFRNQARKALGLVKKGASNMDASQRKKVTNESHHNIGSWSKSALFCCPEPGCVTAFS
uniref:Uncharacterized protein n=1 Tax=Branchiostoma floridae TaxID=7739 RepID=C3ZFV1_BRAFL|eukprot:XP_002592578.1 hypothetical protein BRAFLDRAFT_68900 [Branchiostoma floridae]